jgi:hypothetical protein
VSYKEYKCPKCGWVHAALPLDASSQRAYEPFFRCFNCGESARVKLLDAWPESSAETLELIERFARLQQKHGTEYALELTLFCIPVSSTEIDAVLQAEDKLAAAGELCSKKINWWD